MPKPSTRDLTDGAIGRTLLVFALPILAGNALQSLNGSVNAVWVGRFLGEEALVATANANNILFFLLGSVFGIGMAATILVAQAIGAKDAVQARRVIGTSASFFGGLSLLVAAAGLPLARHVLAWMGTPEASLPLAEAYLKVIFLAVPFLYMFAFISAVLRGAGDTRTPFFFLALVVVIDIIVNPLLIFGLGPLPRMGIAGSAAATLVANAASLAALLAWLRWRRHPLWIPRSERRAYIPDLAIVRALVVKGVPMGLQMILVSLAMLVMISMVNAHGVDTASAYGATLQLWTYVQMPAMAVGAACTSMAAQNVGAGRWDRVGGTMRAGVAFNFLLTGALIAPLLLFGPRILSLFLPPGSPSIELGQHINVIAIWSFLFFGVTFVVSGVVRSTGAVIPPLLILGLALWGIRVPFANLLQPSLGADAIWLSFPVSALCAMAMSLAYYRWGGWREARMLAGTGGHEADAVAIPAEVPSQPPGPVADPCPRTSDEETRTAALGRPSGSALR
ncbi:MATE family efflux transporter [Luteimonas sp. MC1750]|uniref:MATE family efflux transporter n=1 Tax=Luteimonas sp. MC1750 TaxID=2799326 RepID=UPI0018F0F8C7|nr:MATE family efflux transporter [Luteimonas sp. MC1750]MBJ6983955.1 MATE family efflux transporter [Luteimonas sp. MC1750]QQO06769.1 MATE family efflux transporter [Luteimonas sp. MC1750]